MTIRMDLDGPGLTHFGRALAALGDEAKARMALSRAINKASARAYTQVKRSLAKQVGAPQARVLRAGAVRRIPASASRLESCITSRGGYTGLKDFRARQVRRGVSAAPWGARRLFRSTFIVPRLGGQVFKRAANRKLKGVYGPAVPKELVQNETAEAFRTTVETVLPAELDRQIRGLSTGAFS